MFVQRVVRQRLAASSRGRCLDRQGRAVEPVERYLAYLSGIERSPNTVKAYAHDLKDWFAFLGAPGPGLAGGAAGGHRRVRRLATGARQAGRGGAVAVLP